MQIVGFGQYAHGNQPIQHMIYLYDWAGEPWKTQYWVREAMDRLYSPTPDGYCGDEDNGQTSAWYVWSALGCYPVCPGTGEYALGAPLFPRATLSFPSGKTLAIEAPGAAANRYVAKLTLDGTELARNYLTRRELQNGGRLSFTTSPEPIRTRGTAPAAAPYSMSGR
jgi:predicted alpha-1,2-mannosidase